jgi:hypothetical protein
MSPGAGQSLRTGLRLANPSGLQAARWAASGHMPYPDAPEASYTMQNPH